MARPKKGNKNVEEKEIADGKGQDCQNDARTVRRPGFIGQTRIEATERRCQETEEGIGEGRPRP
jgi:hypothetical protein